MSAAKAGREAKVDDLLAFADAIRNDEVLWNALLRVGKTGEFSPTEERRIFEILHEYVTRAQILEREWMIVHSVFPRLRRLAVGEIDVLDAPEHRCELDHQIEIRRRQIWNV